ncbi:MAG: DUF6089 family protein [Prevotella sp.]
MKKLAAVAALALAAVTAYAQEEPEYRAEIGGGVGLVSYQGDFNSSLTANMQPIGSLLARYKFNPRMALAFNVSYGKLKGSTDGTETWYPEYHDTAVSFSNTLIDAGLRYEYNFWPYGTGREYRGAQRLTPYTAIGLGMTYVKAQNGSDFAANMAIGVGVKYKVATRLNIGFEWLMRFTTSDNLDGVADPYGIKSSGIFKNTDCYSTIGLSLTYDIMAKCKTCNNDRD